MSKRYRATWDGLKSIEARIVAYCAVCDGEIYEGEPYYNFDDFAVCDDCAFRALTTAEVPEEPFAMEDDDGGML